MQQNERNGRKRLGQGKQWLGGCWLHGEREKKGLRWRWDGEAERFGREEEREKKEKKREKMEKKGKRNNMEK